MGKQRKPFFLVTLDNADSAFLFGKLKDKIDDKIFN